MSYLVLARKYRPQTFDEVYAQEHITQILKNTIELDRTAQAYLFTGPRGVGKTSLARIFAKSLNCLNGGPTITPCNKCTNCVEITEGTSADVIEIDGASNTGVDDIRDLQRELMYSPSNSNFKIYIIDEVHMLSKNAFNALLKTLEEPPKNVIFIFATTEPHKVLPTIISRCQRFDFKRIPIPAIVKQMKFITKKEEISISEEALFLIAKKADGSMRDALSLMDQIIAYGKNDITTDDVLSIFGIVHTDIYNEILKLIHKKDPKNVLKHLHSILEKGNDIQEFINGFLDYLRNILLLKTGLDVPEVSAADKKTMLTLGKKFSENEFLYLITLLIKTKTDIKNSSNPIIIAEMSFVKLTKISDMISIEKIIDSLSSIPEKHEKPTGVTSDIPQMKRSSAPKTETPKTKPAAKIQVDSLTEKVLNDNLEILLKKLKKESSFLSTYLGNCKITKVSENLVEFETSNGTQYKRLKSSKEKISKLFSEHFNLKISVDFIFREKPKEKTIINPTLEQIRAEAPELADFIETLEAEVKTKTDN